MENCLHLRLIYICVLILVPIVQNLVLGCNFGDLTVNENECLSVMRYPNSCKPKWSLWAKEASGVSGLPASIHTLRTWINDRRICTYEPHENYVNKCPPSYLNNGRQCLSFIARTSTFENAVTHCNRRGCGLASASELTGFGFADTWASIKRKTVWIKSTDYNTALYIYTSRKSTMGYGIPKIINRKKRLSYVCSCDYLSQSL